MYRYIKNIFLKTLFYSIQTDSFLTTSASDLKAFIKQNIYSVLTDEAARFFSWTGQHGNVEIRYYTFSKLLEGKKKKPVILNLIANFLFFLFQMLLCKNLEQPVLFRKFVH